MITIADKHFLYRVTGIAGLESPTDRKLICSTTSLSESVDGLTFISPEEEKERYSLLIPNTTVALRHGLDSQYKYYSLNGYEIDTNVGELTQDGEVFKLNKLNLSVKHLDI